MKRLEMYNLKQCVRQQQRTKEKKKRNVNDDNVNSTQMEGLNYEI